MKNTCYHCTHADFRAAHQDQKSDCWAKMICYSAFLTMGYTLAYPR